MDSSRSVTATPTWWIRLSTRPILSLGPTSVAVPAFSGLAAQLAGLHLRLQLWRRPVPLVASRLVHVEPGAVRDVEPAEVAQSEGTHGPVESLFDCKVDVLEAGDAGVEEPVRLLRGCVQDPVDDEAVYLLVDEHRRAAHVA